MTHYPDLEYVGEGIEGINYDYLYDEEDIFISLPVTMSWYIHDTQSSYLEVDIFDISFTTTIPFPVDVLKDILVWESAWYDIKAMKLLPTEYPIIVDCLIEICNNELNEIIIISHHKEVIITGKEC